MSKPRLLDLFCGAGGCSVGYARAGFEVVGIDVEPMPSYPFEFHQMDALRALRHVVEHRRGWDSFDAIHASPPCQAFSLASLYHPGTQDSHPDLVDETRELLEATGLPYVMENGERITFDAAELLACDAVRAAYADVLGLREAA